jgi:hypothetical protein
MEMRCLGTASGCLGAVVGAVAGSMLLSILTQNAIFALPGLMFGGLAGMWAGAYVGLRLMGR